MASDIKTLVERLNPICKRALEGAAELCVSHSHFTVEVEHILARLAEMPQTDMLQTLRQFDLDPSTVIRELSEALNGFKRGNARTPTFSPHLPRLLEEAWVRCSLYLGEPAIRSGGLFWAALDHDGLRGLVLQSVPSLAAIPRGRLEETIREICRVTSEDGNAAAPAAAPGGGRGDGSRGDGSRGDGGRPQQGAGPGGGQGAGQANAAPGRGRGSPTPNLDAYTVDITEQARNGVLDPIHGRDGEIRQIIDILSRRRQNNPILTGEPGVGKTAVVEGFALRIAAGDVPPSLRNISVRVLDIGLLQAGAGMKGEFENRLKGVINEVKGSPRPIILFIDEAHTLIGAGGPAGQGDAANLLKPALARGELRTIAATTWAEYKKYFEKDAALTRRFQVVKVEEPDETTAVGMLRGLVEKLEAHHNVRILDRALFAAVHLSNRYISGRQLPDKAISVLDTACARVGIAQNSSPSELEAVLHRIDTLKLECQRLEREQLSAGEHERRLEELTEEIDRLEQERYRLTARWESESRLVRRILELRGQIDRMRAERAGNGPEFVRLSEELSTRQMELETLQDEAPMVPLCVDQPTVAAVISSWTGIPVGKMMTDEVGSILNLRARMAERIIGQAAAIDSICRRIQTYSANLDEPGKPTGVFLLVGPSGVGKTETAITLADLLYGGERNMVTVNMSEYQEAHTVSNLKGAPPGYVGFGRGGVLTEAVRRNPYSVVLLDEIEKAHPDVVELFYQVFDKGFMEDSEGVFVDFRNTVILCTSNVGDEAIVRACRASGETLPDTEALVDMLHADLLKAFKPAFLGRLVVVPYHPLREVELDRIVALKLGKIQRRFAESHGADLTYDSRVAEVISQRCAFSDSGARAVDNILTHTVLPELSTQILERMAAEETFASVHIVYDEARGFLYNFEDGVAPRRRHLGVA